MLRLYREDWMAKGEIRRNGSTDACGGYVSQAWVEVSQILMGMGM